MEFRIKGSWIVIIVAAAAVLLVLSDCQKNRIHEEQVIQNLRAYAKLYGYTRYFHPSDEASQVDWEQFLICGMEKVKKAQDQRELKVVLEELFLPLAPTIQIYPSGEKPEAPLLHVPKGKTGLKIVAWQHKGLGFGRLPSVYMSLRLNRDNVLTVGTAEMGMISQVVNADHLRGKNIKLEAFVKVEVRGFGNQAQLRLAVLREGNKPGFFDDMHDRPIFSNKWKKHEIRGKVNKDARMIVVGGCLCGQGKVWLDDFKLWALDANKKWQLVDIRNPGFEEGEINHTPKFWSEQKSGYVYKVSEKSSRKGKKCLLIENKYRKVSMPLFKEHPEIGEVVNKELNAHLSCQIPLALYAGEKRTLGKRKGFSFEKLVSEWKSGDLVRLTADNEHLRLAGVIIAWNVFQHFYPYFDVVDVDWEAELTNALKSAQSDKNEEDYYFTLCRLISKLQDGHGNVYYPGLMSRRGFPIQLGWVEDQVVVLASRDPARFQRGDVILSIDGVEAELALLRAEECISGSPQWKRTQSLRWFGFGEPGTAAEIVLNRGQKVLEIVGKREARPFVAEPARPNIQELEGDIFYVNLDRASWEEIHARIHDLAEAHGIVFDLRGYPNGNHQIICHLLRENDTSGAWMQIPLIIYPDRKNIVGWQKMGWKLAAQEPHINGKVVFITDGSAISYAESFLSFIEHYKLGEIVGQPTAGTNGNVNPFDIPGGCRISWTGMKVLKHDGSQHHLIGIQPTVPVIRTLQGVVQGRDEFFERAVELVQ
jgi:hypothetical protein